MEGDNEKEENKKEMTREREKKTLAREGERRK